MRLSLCDILFLLLRRLLYCVEFMREEPTAAAAIIGEGSNETGEKRKYNVFMTKAMVAADRFHIEPKHKREGKNQFTH